METQDHELLQRLQAIMLTMNLNEHVKSKMMKLREKLLLNNSDIELIFQISPKTLWRWRKQKLIEYFEIGPTPYYLWDEVLRKLKERKR